MTGRIPDEQLDRRLRLYRVPLIGSGADDDPIRPDVPDDTAWVGNVISDTHYLIATASDLSAGHGIAPVERSREAVESIVSKQEAVQYEDIMAWRVSS